MPVIRQWADDVQGVLLGGTKTVDVLMVDDDINVLLRTTENRAIVVCLIIATVLILAVAERLEAIVELSVSCVRAPQTGREAGSAAARLT
mgnify:CR=1 FL=1